MKPSNATLLGLILLAVSPVLNARPLDSLGPGDRLMKMGDRVVIIHNGMAVPMTVTMTLSDGSQVAINGAVASKNGAHRNLRDCEIIGADGRRIDDNSARLVLIDGQVMVMKGGVTRRLEMVANLGGGRTVTQDGFLTERNGSRQELKEGQVVAMNGAASGSGSGFEQVKRNLGSAR